MKNLKSFFYKCKNSFVLNGIFWDFEIPDFFPDTPLGFKISGIGIFREIEFPTKFPLPLEKPPLPEVLCYYRHPL